MFLFNEKLLKQKLQEHELSQAEFADKVGLNPASVTRMMQNKQRNINLETAYTICKILNIKLEELIINTNNEIESDKIKFIPLQRLNLTPIIEEIETQLFRFLRKDKLCDADIENLNDNEQAIMALFKKYFALMQSKIQQQSLNNKTKQAIQMMISGLNDKSANLTKDDILEIKKLIEKLNLLSKHNSIDEMLDKVIYTSNDHNRISKVAEEPTKYYNAKLVQGYYEQE